MTDERREPLAGANAGYAAFQLAKALETSQTGGDAETQERASQRANKWKTVLENILFGRVKYGSKTPVKDMPSWVTLEVLTGGFATGELPAGGPLRAHEQAMLRRLPTPPAGEERRAINTYFLSEAGFTELRHWLYSGQYKVEIPEEGALLVVVWLVEKGHIEKAKALLQVIAPYFSQLRFYPVWDEVSPVGGDRVRDNRVHIETVESTIQRIEKIAPNQRILAQKEAVEIWLPLYDRLVALWLEVNLDWLALRYPEGWKKRATAWIKEYKQLREQHSLSAKMARSGHHSTQLRQLLEKCVQPQASLSKRDVDRIQFILEQYQAKRGTPTSQRCIEARHQQKADVNAPMFYQIAPVVTSRLSARPLESGLDDIQPFVAPVSETEADRFDLPVGVSIPQTIQRKVERCLNETVDVLVENGLITSGEVLASVLPQVTADIRALGIADTTLRRLYARIYRAFRQRRSLLLLTLEKQVQLEDLPWIAAVESFHNDRTSSQAIAKQTLTEIVTLTLSAFPHAIIPNKLVQELRALAKTAQIKLPLVDELAADIFIGQLSETFISATLQAASVLEGSLYETYYSIDYAAIRQNFQAEAEPLSDKAREKRSNDFTNLCVKRAGAAQGIRSIAVRGMIIEQQQILTTQNLAVLFKSLPLTQPLSNHLRLMVEQCFQWIHQRQQMKVDDWHARLVAIKNSAYAWRQMIFFLSLLPKAEIDDCLHWMNNYLGEQADDFEYRFRPAMNGLMLSRNLYEEDILSKDKDWSDSSLARENNAKRFLGWSSAKHWLMF